MNQKSQEIIDLIIDAGHGGKDGGASNIPAGLIEEDLTLKISLYQAQRFKEIGGFNVSLTRTSDVDLEPKERAKKVKNSKADLCLCNHINAGGGDGFEIIVALGDDEKLAQLMKAELLATGQNFRRIFTKPSTKNPSIDYYYMHRDTKPVKTYIIEYGFLDSKLDDIEQLKNNWKAYAEAVVKAVCIYYNVPYKAPKTRAKVTTIQEAVKVLAENKVMSSSTYWLQNASFGKVADGGYTRTLILNFCNAKGYEAGTFDEMLQAMTKQNVINSLVYWQTFAMAGRSVRGEYVEQLIINMANSLL